MRIGNLYRSALILAALASAALSVNVALAQTPVGADELARGIYRLSSEEYDVTVQVLPSRPAAGTVHFVVTPMHAGSGTAVTDATVLIVIDDEEGLPTYQSLALNTPDQPNQYRANLLVKRAGDWTVRVRMDAGGTQSELSLPLPVIDRSITGGIGGTLVFFAVLGVLISVGAYLALVVSRKRRARSSP